MRTHYLPIYYSIGSARFSTNEEELDKKKFNTYIDSSITNLYSMIRFRKSLKESLLAKKIVIKR